MHPKCGDESIILPQNNTGLLYNIKTNTNSYVRSLTKCTQNSWRKSLIYSQSSEA